MLKPICFIGARGGSKGVKQKNIRQLDGKPLIAHTIEKAIESKLFSHVIVSTEDMKIAKIAKKFGAEVPFMRPAKFATDNARMMDVWRHGINKLYSLGYKFEIIVSLDCTAPFLRSYDIKKSIKLLKKEKCNAVFGVYEQHLNPYFNMMEKNSLGFLDLSKKNKKRIIRRQDAPVVYQIMGLFTMYVDKLLKYDNHMMPEIIPMEIPIETGLMIDTEIEFKFAELLVESKFLKK
jgi:CMP-N-acetylneuraminic acid synthetase